MFNKIYKYEYYPTKRGILGKIITRYHLFRINRLKPKNLINNNKIKEIAEKNKKLIIQIMYGGLGDHLVYSSLPQLLWEQKGIKTYISNKSIYRSAEIKNFVWKHNPFIEFTDEKGWYFHGEKIPETKTIDETLQDLFGLHGEGLPKIYYKPKTIQKLIGKKIIDATYGLAGKIAFNYHTKEFQDIFVNYIKKNISNFYLLTHKEKGYLYNEMETRIIKEFNPPCFDISTIKEMSDVFFSAKERYVFHSGSASVSASLNIPSIVICNKKIDHRFAYKKINSYLDITKTNV